jgi:disulfide bond formation protein DsbB
MNSETASDRLIVIACVVIASVATGRSLYFSEIMELSPCELCWIQRIAMYPLVIVLSVAAYEKRTEVRRTALPLSLGGGSVAAYHSYIHRRRRQAVG